MESNFCFSMCLSRNCALRPRAHGRHDGGRKLGQIRIAGAFNAVAGCAGIRADLTETRIGPKICTMHTCSTRAAAARLKGIYSDSAADGDARSAPGILEKRAGCLPAYVNDATRALPRRDS